MTEPGRAGPTRREKANTARRYRLYPTEAQGDRLVAWSHTCRAVWNTALMQRQWAYRSAQRVTLHAAEQCRDLTELRAAHDWVRELPAQCGQQVLRHLDQAYANFWNPSHPAGFPQPKRKREHTIAVPFPGQAVKVRRISRRFAQVWLPKMGWVRFRLSRPLGGTVRNATVSRDGLGWHIAFGVYQPEPQHLPVNDGVPVGVDVGIACSVFVSDEDTPRQRPDTLTAGEKKRLVGLERRKARQLTYAKKHNGGRYSNRLRRTITEIAALNARQARRRLDWNHKLTTDLAHNHGTVAVEDLKVANMSKSAKGTVAQPGQRVAQKRGLNRSIADQGWFEIRRQLRYKTTRHGGQLIAVPAVGTSQTCNQCGTRDPESRQGCGRLFACVHCGHTEHADRNAALTILAKALSTAGQAGLTPSGGGESQSTRSPNGQGTQHGSRMREPTIPGTAA